MRNPTLQAFAAIAALCLSPLCAAQDHYQVAQRQVLPGPERWDYLLFHAADARLFVTRGDHVDVIDTASGKLAGTLPDTDGVHGIAIADDARKGFASNGRSVTVTVFDAARSQVFASAGDGTLTVISAANTAVVQVLATMPTARTMALDDVHHRIYTVGAAIDPSGPAGERPRLVPGTFTLLTITD